MSLPPKEAKLRAEVLSGIGAAIFRLDEYAMRETMYDHPGRALWVISRVEIHLRRARAALRAWRRERVR